MYAIAKNSDQVCARFKQYTEKQSSLILTRPESLSPEKKQIRSEILKTVHENNWWLKCECCSNHQTILFTRKNKNVYTVCRNGNALEHSPLCPVRHWIKREQSTLSERSKCVFEQILANTNMGRLLISDFSKERLTAQYSSIKNFSREVKAKEGEVQIITHPAALKGIKKLAQGQPNTHIYAAVVSDRIERYRTYCPNGVHIDAPVILADKVDSSAKTWMVVTEFDHEGNSLESYAHPIISKADLVAVSNRNEYLLVKTLRSLISYWSKQSGETVEALRTYRNACPTWCLYKNIEKGEKRYFADVVIETQTDQSEIQKLYGQASYAIPAMEMDSIDYVLTQLRKGLTWRFFNGK